MTTEYAGSGDPARTIALLWGTQTRPTRGPKPGLSVDRIVRAAIEVADAAGLAALSMRRVAAHLGFSPMGLYTYVPGRAELIDLMLDAVHGELPRSDEPSGDWRTRLGAIARANWDLYRRHPWMLEVAATTRPPLGPNGTAKYDHELRAVDGIGLSEVEMDSIVALVAGHVEGAARRAQEAAQAERRTGLTDEQWWESVGPVLAAVFDAERFPTAARVGPVAGATYGAAYDPESAFAFGLERILDGIEVLVRSRATDPSTP